MTKGMVGGHIWTKTGWSWCWRSRDMFRRQSKTTAHLGIFWQGLKKSATYLQRHPPSSNHIRDYLAVADTPLILTSENGPVQSSLVLV
jgi:hypothetical protein